MKVLKLHFNYIPQIEYESLEEAMSDEGTNVRYQFVTFVSMQGVILSLFDREDGAYPESKEYTKEKAPNLHEIVEYALSNKYAYVEFHIDGIKPEVESENYRWYEDNKDEENELWETFGND